VWPGRFRSAKGSFVRDAHGREYLDFFSGAGALNYGHNPDKLIRAAQEYLARDGILHSLDMMTDAKFEFLDELAAVLERTFRNRYRVQFTGPTGTNSIEAALKLARKVVGRQTVVAFTRAFHGVTIGALAVTADHAKRRAAGISLDHVLRLPYDGYGSVASYGIDLLRDYLTDPGSGIETPAAVLVETVQAEGGVNVGSEAWLSELRHVCDEHGMLLIIDDIQVGCGRTGWFFSAAGMGWDPDVICLSKSLSGLGFPLAVVVLRADLDVWEPGEHNGTFRGNNLAFVTGAAALREYWGTDALAADIDRKSRLITDHLRDLQTRFPDLIRAVRGKGMIVGVEAAVDGVASKIAARCYELGLLIETCGPRDTVLKLLPALTIADEHLSRGLNLLEAAIVWAADV
jgi:diaminobutyrate-2-oxoglutarate transaminase